MNRRGSLATIALECPSGACRGKALECVRNRLAATSAVRLALPRMVMIILREAQPRAGRKGSVGPVR